MTEHTPDAARQKKYERARSSEEPGAHSGSESQPRERVVPGTASAREGYHKAGTGRGEPLAGVEAAPEEAAGNPPETDSGSGSGSR
ncbi:hypothetical protein ACH44C_03440 [Streptomyces purpureus]|uniref:hypothetical protein n=1 Tax=Streptomyces purpureus TaxID=1951 RepID=UPI00037A010E|nr:hypothetical protein [Streptomyces purpureus]